MEKIKINVSQGYLEIDEALNVTPLVKYIIQNININQFNKDQFQAWITTETRSMIDQLNEIVPIFSNSIKEFENMLKNPKELLSISHQNTVIYTLGKSVSLSSQLRQFG